MSLRVRLTAGILALVVLALVAFSLVTYGVYSNSQYRQLDQQVRSSIPYVSHELLSAAGFEPSQPGFQPGGPAASGPLSYSPEAGPGPGQPNVVETAFGELVSPRGKVLSHIDYASTSTAPLISIGTIERHPAGIISLSSRSGATAWRAAVTAGVNGDYLVVALPTTGVISSLHRLVIVEVFGILALVVVVCAGVWLVVGRGLSPLETMATTAGRIAAGALDERVASEGTASEVHALAVSFNHMLDQIQVAFAAQQTSEARLRQFLADASHELRTPLTSIQGFAELFRLAPDDDSVDRATMMRRIEDESKRMKELVNDLLVLARLDETRPHQRVPVDLAVLAADACTDASASGSGHTLQLDAAGPIVVLGDESLLRQAVTNLVANAQAHTAAPGPIEVSAFLADNHGSIAVRDHGSGLSAEALEHVFDRFWRADPSRAGSGSGLGLSIVAGIASEHGGQAWAENAEGGGARFVLRLPISRDH